MGRSSINPGHETPHPPEAHGVEADPGEQADPADTSRDQRRNEPGVGKSEHQEERGGSDGEHRRRRSTWAVSARSSSSSRDGHVRSQQPGRVSRERSTGREPELEDRSGEMGIGRRRRCRPAVEFIDDTPAPLDVFDNRNQRSPARLGRRNRLRRPAGRWHRPAAQERGAERAEERPDRRRRRHRRPAERSTTGTSDREPGPITPTHPTNATIGIRRFTAPPLPLGRPVGLTAISTTRRADP